MVWIQFVVCLAVIGIAGTKLVKYGDLLAEKTGLGRVWVGVVVLAAITSIPELATGISSVTLIGDPDLTMGDLFGSNMVNLVMIAVIDLFYTGGPVLSYVGAGIVLTAALSSVLIAVVALSIYLSQGLFNIKLFGMIGMSSLVLLLLYLLAQYILFRFRPDGSEQTAPEESPAFGNHTPLRTVVISFVAAAVVTAAGGTWLASIGAQIAELTGLGSSFVGTLFLAICTSAPELVVSISAARLGALDMAVGNMVGSNLFNMGVVIFVNDLFYAGGPILQRVNPSHVVTALFALLMSSVVVIGVTFRPRLRLRFPIGPASLFLIIIYLGAMVTLYSLSR